MKRILLAALIVGGTMWTTVSQASLSLGFSSDTTGSEIQFSGTTFDITAGTPDQWLITTETGGTGSAVGLYGSFSGGPWSIGAITSTTPIAGLTIQTASVSAGGGITINDGAALLTGSVNWIQLQTINNGGSINSSATVNITGLAYSGVNADLATLAQGDGSVTLTFQFASDGMLTNLTDGGTYGTSFSGSIASVPVPEPTTIIAGALLLLPFGFSTLRIVRKQNRAA